MGLKRGYVHVFTGDGKGKTTAALGMCLRASGHGLKCLVIQFMKGNIEHGEVMATRRLPLDLIDIRQMGREMNGKNGQDSSAPEQIDIKWARDALRAATKAFEKRSHDLVVLDEVNTAVAGGLVHIDDLLAVLDARPADVELVLTGNGAPPEILAEAHVVTEMRRLKHYADMGVAPRDGIEL